MTVNDIAARYGINGAEFERFLRMEGKQFTVTAFGQTSVDDMNVFGYVEEFKAKSVSYPPRQGGFAAGANVPYVNQPKLAGAGLLSLLYSNIGRKICLVAKLVCSLGVLAIIIGLGFVAWGLIDYEDEAFILGCAAAGGGLIFIISSFIIYAVGQLVDDVHAIRESVTRTN